MRKASVPKNMQLHNIRGREGRFWQLLNAPRRIADLRPKVKLHLSALEIEPESSAQVVVHQVG
jgi:hypothetical protein